MNFSLWKINDAAATCECKIIYFIMTIHFSGSIQSTFFSVLFRDTFSPKDKEDETGRGTGSDVV